MIYRVIYKIKRLLWLFFHPYLWCKNVQINGIPTIQKPEKFKIGRYVSFNENVFIQSQGEIILGNNVTLSYGATILTEGLELKSYAIRCMEKERKHISNNVVIGDGTWIAANVTVLPGSVIPSGCVIAAGAVVNGKLTEKNALYAGVPAKFIRKLD